MRAPYDRVAGLYDLAAPGWDRTLVSAALARFRAEIHRSVGDGALVLDVGAGSGRSTALLLAASRPRRVVGVDLSAGMLARARRRLGDPRVELVRADATRLPFPDDTFDMVTSLWMQETLPDPLAGLRECLRVLRPGGTVVAGFSTLPVEPLAVAVARAAELVMEPVFAGHFLRREEQPLPAWTMDCHSWSREGLATVATYGKRCLPALERVAR